MRSIFLFISVSIGLAILAFPSAADAQFNRDYVFTEKDDHLVLRFASKEAGSLNPDQAYEIHNAEFSSMIHDHLRADLLFDAEPVDAEWADAFEPSLARLVGEMTIDIDAVFVQCKSATCRLTLEQETLRTVSEHQAEMDSVQTSIQAFIDANPTRLAPVFLIAAYRKDLEIPAIKIYLTRAPH